MPEFRKDPVSDHWVIVAPERASRPEQFDPTQADRLPSRCPFCRGNEDDTPETIAAYDRHGHPVNDDTWQVRVIPNKYPALDMRQRPTDGRGPNEPPSEHPPSDQQSSDQQRPTERTSNGRPSSDHPATKHPSTNRSADQTPPPPWSPPGGSGLYEAIPGIGIHEVIVESPDHLDRFGALDAHQMRLAWLAYRDRLRHLSGNPRIAYGQLFKNSGAAAGASLEHVHSQLIGTPLVPTQIQTELARSRAYFERHGTCVFCAMIQAELADGTRIVSDSASFVAFCPFASQFPYETWILPKHHGSHFERAEDAEIGELALAVRDVLHRIELALDNPAFNFLIHTSPFRVSSVSYFHWHLEFFPRLTKTAGFEWGAGDYINTVSPEDAARRLRAACPDGALP